jgi:hypothetical protein
MIVREPAAAHLSVVVDVAFYRKSDKGSRSSPPRGKRGTVDLAARAHGIWLRGRVQRRARRKLRAMRMRRATSRELEAFLTAEDLDDLLRARQQLGRVSRRDSQAAASVLEQWTARQAGANVLFYPDLLPRSVRIAFLMKALEEAEFPYYTLAAVVGLQDLTGEEFEGAPELRKAVGEQLVTLIERADEVMRAWDTAATGAHTMDEVIADRASTMLLEYVERADALQLVRFLDHPSEVVRNNVLYTLVDLFGTQEVERQVGEAAEAGQTSSAAPAFVRDNMNERLMMLWAYIPNLVQIFPAEDMEGDVGK